jgi:hypothetical protein
LAFDQLNTTTPSGGYRPGVSVPVRSVCMVSLAGRGAVIR